MSYEISDNEKELISRIARSDEKAFEKIYTLYTDRIYGVAFSYTKSAAFSEEIVQDVFLKLWVKREQLSHVESLENYVFIMARNRILNKLKSTAREKEQLKELASFFKNNTLTPDQELAFKQSNEVIEQAIMQLPAQQQLVYQLAKHEGLSRAQIAKQLNLSENTVKNHLGQAMQYIRAYVHRHSGPIICLLALLLLEL